MGQQPVSECVVSLSPTLCGFTFYNVAQDVQQGFHDWGWEQNETGMKTCSIVSSVGVSKATWCISGSGCVMCKKGFSLILCQTKLPCPLLYCRQGLIWLVRTLLVSLLLCVQDDEAGSFPAGIVLSSVMTTGFRLDTLGLVNLNTSNSWVLAGTRLRVCKLWLLIA